jgi:hypothetical protein
VFRRSRPTAEEPGQDEADDSAAEELSDPAPGRSHAVTAGKGRPTPKRSEAERRRRQPYTAPKDRKEASRAVRDRQREDRTRRMEAVRRGEEWALPVRDRGPAKALVRDYVDSRRRLSEYYLFGVFALILLLVVRTALVQSIVDGLIIVAVLIMLVEGIFIGRGARALVTERYPKESTRGVALYAALRALQYRRLRMPKPRISPGDEY